MRMTRETAVLCDGCGGTNLVAIAVGKAERIGERSNGREITNKALALQGIHLEAGDAAPEAAGRP